MERIDLSKFERDDLRDLLSIAKNEWAEYTYCKNAVESCEKRIEKEKENIEANNGGNRQIWLGLLSLLMVLMLFLYKNILGNYHLYLLLFSLFCVVYFFYSSTILKRRKKVAQNMVDEYELELSELRKKEINEIGKLNKVWAIPDEYCYDYAFTKMLQYLDSFKAHNWKEVTTLYDRHVHEQTMENNTRIAAEEAMEQTEIARQTRNAARAAAAGAWVSAVRS